MRMYSTNAVPSNSGFPVQANSVPDSYYKSGNPLSKFTSCLVNLLGCAFERLPCCRYNVAKFDDQQVSHCLHYIPWKLLYGGGAL